MHRRHLLFAALGSTIQGTPANATLPPSAANVRGALHWRQRVMVGLGTTLSLRAAHTRPEQAEAALDAAVAAIARVESSMSLHRPDSELVRLNRQGHLNRPSADFLAVLRMAQRVSQRSQGQFDVSVQPLWTLYAQAQRQGRLPTSAEISAAKRCVGWQHVVINDQRIELRQPGMALTFNGIAQGFATELAQQALQRHGVAHALIHAGEYASLGHNDRGQRWTLGIENPLDEQRLLTALRADGRAVATSADNRSAFSANHLHHHIFDPLTGQSPQALSSVTILAPSAMLADALTKVMFVAGPQHIPALARTWQVGVLWVDKNGHWQATGDVPVV